MLNSIEIEIIQKIILHSQMKDDYLLERSIRIAPNSSGNEFSFSEFQSASFPVSEDVFHDWKEKNQNPIEFYSLPTELGVSIISQEKFDQIQNHWKVLYTLTRPGYTDKSAIIQITAYCPAGPPNYGSIYLLQKEKNQWKISHTLGLYNQ